MKRTLVGGLVAALLVPTAAIAADVPVRRPAPPPVMAPPPVLWTGFYFGIHGGFGGDRYRYPFSIGPVVGEARSNSSGFFGGGQVGFNWQFSPAWVAGIEADIAVADIEGRPRLTATAFGTTVTLEGGSKLEWFGTVRGRVGFLITPVALLYGTGGFAYGHTRQSATISVVPGPVFSRAFSKTKHGWTAGAGLEYMLLPWLTVKTEYLYVDLGRHRITTEPVGPFILRIDERAAFHTVKLGLNMRFGGP
jgi:outer membrane immunogenic protein